MSKEINPSRRQFLKNGTVAAAGTAIASNLTSLTSSVHAAGSDVLKVGLVGCGGRGTGAANNALNADPNTKLVALADVFQDQADASLSTLKGQQSIADRVTVDKDHVFVGLDAYQKVIDCTDVVLLCTPPGFRPEHLRAAVDAGRHLFTEKPMATDSHGVRSVIQSVELAKKKGLSVVAGFCWRYDLSKQALFQRILGGAIGDVRAVHGTYLGGPVKPMPVADTRPDGISDLKWMLRNWYNFAGFSGDGLVEQACHTVDWIAWAFDDVPPISCTAVGGRQIPSEGGDIFDHIEVNYEWDNDARGFLAQRQIVGCYNQNNLYLLGTKGSATLTRGSQINDISGKRLWKYDGPGNDMYQTEHEELFTSIRSGQPINDGDRMVNSTQMAIMGRMAGYTGKKVTWEEAMNSQEMLMPEITDGWDTPVTFRAVPRPGVTGNV